MQLRRFEVRAPLATGSGEGLIPAAMPVPTVSNHAHRRAWKTANTAAFRSQSRRKDPDMGESPARSIRYPRASGPPRSEAPLSGRARRAPLGRRAANAAAPVGIEVPAALAMGSEEALSWRLLRSLSLLTLAHLQRRWRNTIE